MMSLKFMNIQINLCLCLPIRLEYYVVALLCYQVWYSRAIINRDVGNFISITPSFFHDLSFISNAFIKKHEYSNKIICISNHVKSTSSD